MQIGSAVSSRVHRHRVLKATENKIERAEGNHFLKIQQRKTLEKELSFRDRISSAQKRHEDGRVNQSLSDLIVYQLFTLFNAPFSYYNV